MGIKLMTNPALLRHRNADDICTPAEYDAAVAHALMRAADIIPSAYRKLLFDGAAQILRDDFGIEE